MTAESIDNIKQAQNAPKRPLFNKPAWAKPKTVLESDLFRRSGHSYVKLGSKWERGKRREPTRVPQGPFEQQANGHRSCKRIRISGEETSEDTTEDSLSETGTNIHADGSSLLESDTQVKQKLKEALQSSVKPSFVQQYETCVAQATAIADKQQSVSASDIIDLEDDSGYGILTPAKELRKSSLEVLETTVEDSRTACEEEFPDLARRAREKARQKHLEEDLVKLTRNSQTEWHVDSTDTPRYSSPPAAQDPTLQILITSCIENTKPLIVNRKLSQRLKDVRLAWAERQGFSNDFAETIFLTWRGRRLFDVTTCKGLDLKVDIEGRVFAKGDVLGDEEGRLHMVATTPELFAAQKRAKGDPQPQQEQRRGFTLEEKSDKEPQTKIILKAQGFSDFKLIVKPSTLISKIINAFRSTYNIPTCKDVFLLFDGERLLPGCRIQDTDISDMDHIDTYLLGNLFCITLSRAVLMTAKLEADNHQS